MSKQLKICDWAMRLGAMSAKSECLAWLLGPVDFITLKAKFKPHHVPSNIMRRASYLTLMALDVALELCPAELPPYAVFASRHGEISQTCALLKDIGQRQELSPMSFSQSVHNTAAGHFTIAKKAHIKVTSLAAGENTFPMALVEAYAYLRTYPDHQLLMVMFDEVLPPYYQKDIGEPSANYSLGLILGLAHDESMTTSKVFSQNRSHLPVALNAFSQILQQPDPTIIDLNHWQRHQQ